MLFVFLFIIIVFYNAPARRRRTNQKRCSYGNRTRTRHQGQDSPFRCLWSVASFMFLEDENDGATRRLLRYAAGGSFFSS